MKNKFSRLAASAVFCAAAFGFSGAAGFAANAAKNPVLEALRIEMNRNIKKLKFENFSPPYFISNQLSDTADATITARYGSLIQDQSSRARYLYVDLRYGSYDMDNSREGYRGAFDSAPLEDDIASIRHQLWLMTDLAYKQAVKEYLQKQGKKVSEIEKDKISDFSREKPVRKILPPKNGSDGFGAYREILKRVSAEFKKYRQIDSSGISLRRVLKTNYLVNTEGTELVMPGAGNPYFIYIWAGAQADDGMNLDLSRTLSIADETKLPSERELAKIATDLAEQLLLLRKAKLTDPYTAPAILDPESTGVLFHEALGHRLEGERQRDEDEGQTFKGQIGKEVVPKFISVEDDPTLRAWNGMELNGYYQYDDEAVPAERVVLVENGVLKNYLMSRRPILGFDKSNGHGRAQFGRDPIGRMSNLFVKSTQSYTVPELKKMLLEECVKQNKPYGLILKRTRSGDTATTRGRYQAFRGTPEEVYLVDAKTGQETLVRGVELVGTPLITANKILATGNQYEVNNAFCVAESGTVPVSTIAPYIFVKEVELQRLREDKQRPPILPPPLYDSGASQ